MLNKLSFYSFFTKYSIMEDYGFTSGLIRRLFGKILPRIPEINSIEYQLIKKKISVSDIVSNIKQSSETKEYISSELNLSITALISKIVAFGLDGDIKNKFHVIQVPIKPFKDLLYHSNQLDNIKQNVTLETINSLEEVRQSIVLLRKNKHQIGTNFHLTVTTKKILEYVDRVKELLTLKTDITSKAHWDKLNHTYLEFNNTKNSIRKYIVRHTDLVALEIVEHTANKGEKYIAESNQEYWKFFKKSLLGGAIISIFALIKIYFDSVELNELQSALIFSLNYAFCFVFVTQFGGIIATKQPAVTASRIAKGIDENDNLQIDSIQNITRLIRKVARSQFISIIGNFMMAILFACLISFVFISLGVNEITKTIDPNYLMKNAKPSLSLVFYASIAGIFLALSGIISGTITNKIIASKIPHRISNSNLFFNSQKFSNFIKSKSGPLIGNISLGFLLGSAFLFSNILPFDIDIRHIAFSSANIGYAIMNAEFEINFIGYAMLGAILIGTINFLISFSITLFIAIKSRGANLNLLPKIFYNVLKDFFKNPISYFIYREK